MKACTQPQGDDDFDAAIQVSIHKDVGYFAAIK